MSPPNSTTYRAVCLALQQMVEERVGRPLTREEQAGIWNAGSLMMLEAVERAIVQTRDTAALPDMLRADAVAFQDRFIAARAKTARLLATHPVRAFFAGHTAHLKAATTIYDLMVIVEQYPETRQRPR